MAAEFTLTESEIAVLKAARAILKVVDTRCRETATRDVDEKEFNRNYNLGKMSEACDVAEGAVFNVLNTADSYLNVDVGVL